MSLLLIGGVVGALLAVLPQQSVAPRAAAAAAVTRFFRDDRTVVNGLVRIPHGMLSPITTGPGQTAAYSLAVRVADQSGTVLMQDEWSRQMPWRTSSLQGAESVEPFAFVLAPGTYDVKIDVRDSATGQVQHVELPVTGFTARPPASDLLLAFSIRQVAAGSRDTVPIAGELRKGEFFIASAPIVTLVPSHAMLWYYCELYRDSAATVPWRLEVRRPDGTAVVTSATGQTAFGPGGGPIVGSIDLAGLPPGTYTLALLAGAGADTLTRTTGFAMGGFETEREVAAATPMVAEPEDMFSNASEAQLDSLFDPLEYISKSGELGLYKGLSAEGKRRFLRVFWRRRDPTPGTSKNEEMDAFYARIAKANERYREGGGSLTPGWATDRGRVFIRYGDPDLVLHRPETGPDLPWEAWKYTKSRQLKFVFLDHTRLGHYVLIYTDDRLERNPGDWEHFLSQEAIQEINTF